MAVNTAALVSPQQDQSMPDPNKQSDFQKLMDALTVANGVTGIGSDALSIKKYANQPAVNNAAQDAIARRIGYTGQ